MRILHVVTLVSDDGAYGGPLRVAMNQVRELRARGHDARLAAGWQGAGDPPKAMEGVPVHLFPARQVVPGGGFSGLVSPGLGRWLRSAVPGADVVHVHSGRDLIGLSALRTARVAGRPTVVQTHGMVGVDVRPKARLLDALMVRRELRSARRQLVLTRDEADQLPSVMRRGDRLHRVANGVPFDAEISPSISTASPEVLYCARLHQRKRPREFVRMAALLADRHPEARFALVGPDEGEGALVRQLIQSEGLSARVAYEGALPYATVLDRMSTASVYVLPSVDEPFPMSLLEAMSIGLPCVCTNSTGISDSLREKGAAIVTDGTPVAMAAAVSSLLRDRSRREKLGQRAAQVVRESFSIKAVVDDLEELYGVVRAESLSV